MTDTDPGGRPDPEAGSETGRRPDLTVVVPSVNGSDVLLDCLHALARQQGDVRLEVVVPERCGEGVRDTVRARHPGVILLPVPPATPIPEMRRLAFERARAPSVAVIEDHVMVPPGWAAALVAARAEGHAVVGGSVVNAATESLVDRAAFLCEYGHLLRPLPPGPAPWLTGNNVVYARELLARYREVIDEGRWENHLHEAVLRDGIPLMSRPSIEVAHKMHYRSATEYAGQRFLYSRAYAGMKARGMRPAARLVYGLGTVLLPPVLLARIGARAWAVPEHRGDLVRSLPLLGFFVVAWALGEAAGAFSGPGDALGRVR